MVDIYTKVVDFLCFERGIIMRRNKEAYMNYVCERCWNTLNKCTCKIFPPYTLTWIDRPIQEHIRILNNKGYGTGGCCESHYNGDCITLYISFFDEYGLKNMTESELPKGFKYNSKRRDIYHDFSKNISEEEYNQKKEVLIADLLKWCKELPERPKRTTFPFS